MKEIKANEKKDKRGTLSNLAVHENNSIFEEIETPSSFKNIKSVFPFNQIYALQVTKNIFVAPTSIIM